MIHPNDRAEIEEEIERYSMSYPVPFALAPNLRLISMLLAETYRLEQEVERQMRKNLDERTLPPTERGTVQSFKAQEIKKIVERVSKTTPPTGETTWWFEKDGTGYLVATGSDPNWRSKKSWRTSEDFGHFSRREDADFVSHAREDVLWLLQELATLKKGLTPQEHPDTELLVEALARLHTWDQLGGDERRADKHPPTYYDLIRMQRWVDVVAWGDDAEGADYPDDLEKRFQSLNERIHPRARKLLADVIEKNEKHLAQFAVSEE